jgi:hypothetical protein
MGNMILPGTYIQVRPEGLIAPGQVTVGNLGVIGTAAKGPINKPVLLSSYTDALQTFYHFDLWVDGTKNELTLVRALQLAFNFGANTIYAVRVAGAGNAKASIILKSATGECVALTAKTEGDWGNDLGVNIGPADQNAQISEETHLGSEPAPLSLKRIPIFPSARNRATLHVDATNITKTLKILYDDNPAAPLLGQVKINRATGAMTFGDAVLAADKVTATYLVNKSKAAKVTIQLDQQKETYTVVDGQNLFDEISDKLTGSKWVTATLKANAKEIPLPSNPVDSVSSLSGGENGEANADYQAGLDALLDQEAHIIVAAGQDDGFGGTLDQHCQKASTDEVKHDRIAVVGSKVVALNTDGSKQASSDVIDALQGHNLDSDRVIFVTPGMEMKDVTGDTVTLPGAYTAAAFAGLLASLPAHVSPTNKSLSVNDLQFYFNNAQLEVLVESRVLAIEKRSGFRIVKGITTTTGSAFAQITTRRIVDFAKFGVRLAADPFIGLLNNERVRTALHGSINSFLAEMVKDEKLIAYDLTVSATRDEQIKGIASVTMTLQPVFSIDYIKVTMFLQ